MKKVYTISVYGGNISRSPSCDFTSKKQALKEGAYLRDNEPGAKGFSLVVNNDQQSATLYPKKGN